MRLEELEINGPTVYGYAPLQERIAKFNGVARENVVAATGTSMANHLAMAALFEPGDEVLIEEPTYELLLSAAEFLGANIRRFPRHSAMAFAIDPEDVRKAITPKTAADRDHQPAQSEQRSGGRCDTASKLASGRRGGRAGAGGRGLSREPLGEAAQSLRSIWVTVRGDEQPDQGLRVERSALWVDPGGIENWRKGCGGSMIFLRRRRRIRRN